MDSEQKRLCIVTALGSFAGAAISGLAVCKIKDLEIHNLKFKIELLYRIGLGLAGANDQLNAELAELKKQ